MPFQLATPPSTAPASLPVSMTATGLPCVAAMAGVAKARVVAMRMVWDKAWGMDDLLDEFARC
jgi:hypothetical protein